MYCVAYRERCLRCRTESVEKCLRRHLFSAALCRSLFQPLPFALLFLGGFSSAEKETDTTIQQRHFMGIGACFIWTLPRVPLISDICFLGRQVDLSTKTYLNWSFSDYKGIAIRNPKSGEYRCGSAKFNGTCSSPKWSLYSFFIVEGKFLYFVIVICSTPNVCGDRNGR